MEKIENSAAAAALGCGQSIWIDGIDRQWVNDGFLKDLVDAHGLRGLTSNPEIFEQAMTRSAAYRGQLTEILGNQAVGVKSLYEQLAIRDIQDAADLLSPVHEQSQGTDGWVSFEVSPALAHDTERTLEEARRLWRSVDRPNLMIKVPATAEGIPAIRTLIAEGISVNVTLLFSRERYLEAAEAYLGGLEERRHLGKSIRRIASVASFFISRIDVAIDHELEQLIQKNIRVQDASALLGKIAIASAKNVYTDFQAILSAPRWRALAQEGAHPQRLLWASTSVKNPAYPDTLYVDELIGSDTVNTLPWATFKAFEDHGRVKTRAAETLTEGVDEARARLQALSELGISLNRITGELLAQGVKKFSEPFSQLMGHLEKKRREFSFPLGHSRPRSDTANGGLPPINEISIRVLPEWMGPVGNQLRQWREGGCTARLWQGDAGLWTGVDEGRWVDWLTVADRQLERLPELKAFSELIRESRLTDVVLLGMGGSSLAAEVLSTTFSEAQGFPDFHVLDSTDPEQIADLTKKINLTRALFIVSSKSGTTLEPRLFFEYFMGQLLASLQGKGCETPSVDEVGRHFVAITDPGSALEKVANEHHFLRVFHGLPGIGGRYSALSDFGIVPAAVLGIDLERLLVHAKAMRIACDADVPAEDHPGVILGAALATFAKKGRNKVTLIASTEICELGAWIEQLLAESTGKRGRGLIPIVNEELGSVDSYGDDRVFVHLDYPDRDSNEVNHILDELERQGHPVIRITVPERYAIAQEFYRWEFATSVVGSILGINPFDQPDVEFSKVETSRLTDEFERKGALPREVPFFDFGEIQLFADARNQAELAQLIGGEGPSLARYLAAHLDRVHPGDYFAILAYLPAEPATDLILQSLRREIRDRRQVATCLGYGPSFLHSTGQVYKGGPNQGVFLQITTDHEQELAVPGHRFGFGLVEAAQARGDLKVLEDRGRRVLRIHLPDRQSRGRIHKLARLREAFNGIFRARADYPDNRGTREVA